MNQLASSTVQTVSPRSPSSPRLTGRWLVMARAVWVLVALACLTIFIVNMPLLYKSIAAFDGSSSPPLAVVRQGLGDLGIPERLYILTRFLVATIVACSFLGTGILLFWRRSDERSALLFSLQLMIFGPVMALPHSANPTTHMVDFAVNLSFTSFFFGWYLFPDGRFVPRWTRWLLILWIVNTAGGSFFPGTFLDPNSWPPLLNTPFFLVMFGSCIAAPIYRYRRVSSPVQRQQIKWLIFGFAVVVLLFIAYWMPLLIIPTLSEAGRTAALYDLIGGTVQVSSFILVPFAMGVAILRYRLWDIDPIVNRTLMFGALTMSVIGLYILVVEYFSAFFSNAANNPIVSLIATGIVAVLFQPLRSWLQRGVNHLMYGQRDDPYAVITQLGRRLEATLVPDALLPTMVRTVRKALKLPYAAITLKEIDHYSIAAEDGVEKETLVRLPIIYQTEQLGEFVLATRAPGEPFSSADRRLLNDLALQAGLAIHEVLLTQNLKRTNEELLQVRTQLVTTREEERRRLRRDLHDGFGSVLASLNLRSGAIRALLKRDPRAADALVVEQQETIRSAIADLRLLVQNLRPPVLDELGLGAALGKLANQHSVVIGESNERNLVNRLQIQVDINEPLPLLSAAVEVAVYRIVQEALTNVAKHAKAQICQVQLFIDEGFLCVKITDDGIGLQEGTQKGVGILSMRERAMELGGTCDIGQVVPGGTRILARLPLGKV